MFFVSLVFVSFFVFAVVFFFFSFFVVAGVSYAFFSSSFGEIVFGVVFLFCLVFFL